MLRWLFPFPRQTNLFVCGTEWVDCGGGLWGWIVSGFECNIVNIQFVRNETRYIYIFYSDFQKIKPNS